MGVDKAHATMGRVLSKERVGSVQRLSAIRFVGVSAIFVLALALSVTTEDRGWKSYAPILGVYWVASALLALVPYRFTSLTRWAGLGIALVDVPVVFWLQHQVLPLSPVPAGVAGFTFGLFMLLVLLATLSWTAGWWLPSR